MLVAGGYGREYLSDVYVVDLDARSAQKVTENGFVFDCYNQAAQSENGDVFAAVYSRKDYHIHVLHYNSSLQTMQSIHDYGSP